MVSDSRSRRVRHPILHLEVLSRDGTSTTSHHVFCRLRRTSVNVADCVACPRANAIVGGPSPAVECTVNLRAEDLAPDVGGEHLEVAVLLSSGVTVIDQSALLRDAIRMLQDSSRRSVAIVDAEHRVLGVVHEMVAGRRLIDLGVSDVAVVMTSALAIHEATPVRMALRLLASSHRRDALVVRADGTPLGVFRDVDGLRWIARARAGGGDQAIEHEQQEERSES